MSQRYIGGLIYNPPGGFSGYFDGSGDYLDAGAQTAFSFGTGAWTIEAWVFVTTLQEILLFDTRSSASTAGVGARIDANGTLFYSGSANNSLTTNAIAANTWTHVAWVYDGTTLSGYINGVRGGTATPGFNITQNNGVIGRVGFAASGYMAGYISNLRVVKGSAVYSGASFDPPNGPLQAITNTSLLTCAYPTFRDGSSNNFTITVNGNTAVSVQNPFPQTQLPNPALGNQGNGVYSMSQYQALRSQNLWPAIDPYFDYVTLMLHGNGTNGAQNNTFLDSSTNNFTITRNGNTTQGTFTPYGSNWSNFNPDSDNGIGVATNAALNMGTGDFTVEAWVNTAKLPTTNAFQTSSGGYQCVFGTGPNNGATGTQLYIGVTNLFFDISSDGSGPISVAHNMAAGQWYHVAITRSGTTFRAFINGALVQTATSSASWVDGYNYGIMRAEPIGGYGGAWWYGYVSNFRVVKGTAVYTSNFTPSTTPLTAISGTSLLTCQSNRFIDNSSNAFAITVNGSPSVQRFSPFAPTTPYAADVIGGSGYFDGSGDYIQAADSASLSFSGDFTCEGWFYYTGTAASLVPSILIDSGTSAVSAFEINNGSTYLQLAGQVTNNTISRTTFSGTVVPGAWTHIAYVRSSNVISVYVNGVVSATTLSNSVATGRIRQVGDGRTSGLPFPGYISNFRLVGSAVYTSNFTPPASPVTAITNTQLLCDFTNAGIIDNAEMNNLETVGNAQISTSVSKFGGGSLAFDGSGDYLFGPANQNAALGTGDFTLEAWVYVTTFSTTTGFQAIFSNRNSNSAQASFDFGIRNSDRYLYFYNRNTDASTFSTSGISGTNTWTHVAIVRVGSTITFYINGTSAGTVSVSTNSFGSSNVIYVGTNFNTTPDIYNGNIDDLRITKYARYTANFTPQRSQWQDQ